jgi:predicted nucleotidyltransferase
LQADEEIHLRELVRVTGFSPRSVNKEVDRLVDAGILLERRSSNRRYLRANKSHQLFNDLRNIIDKTIGFVPALTAALAEEKGIKLALLFGSAAAGSEGPASDVDLLVVGSITLSRVLSITRPIQERIGRQINPMVIGAREFRQRRAKMEHLAAIPQDLGPGNRQSSRNSRARADRCCRSADFTLPSTA